MGASLFLLSRGWSGSCYLYQESRELFAKVGEMASPERPLGSCIMQTHPQLQGGNLCSFYNCVLRDKWLVLNGEASGLFCHQGKGCSA